MFFFFSSKRRHTIFLPGSWARRCGKETGIKVSEVRPGMVETEFSVVRFHGDRTAADNVYRGVEPLTGDDIAEAIAWIAQLPAHMNVNEIVLMPSQQACQYYVHRKS